LDKNKSYNVFNVIIKVWGDEYKNIFKDSGVVMLFIIAVFAYPLIYSLAYNNELVKDVPIIVVDESNSELSRQLISWIDATYEVKVEAKTSDFQEGIKSFEQSEVHGVIFIPKNFEERILNFQTATVSVYADAAYMIIYKQIMIAANYSVGTLSAGIEVIRRTAKGNSFDQALSERDPLPIETYALYNPAGGYATYLMPAVLLLILQQTLLLGIGLIGGTLKERGTKNYNTKIGSSFTGAMAIAIGKSMAYFTIYSLNALYTLVVVFRMFSIPMRGNYYEMFIFIFPYLFAVIFLGLSISTFFKKREHALMILVFTSIPFIFLSGFSWPVDSMPDWQVWLSYFIPSTHAIKGFVDLTQKGAEFSDVFHYWINIWGLLVLYLITTTLLFVKLSKKKLSELRNN
jgi:ABC-2 type transport system permease protein